jgi:hypothetical protein
MDKDNLQSDAFSGSSSKAECQIIEALIDKNFKGEKNEEY